MNREWSVYLRVTSKIDLDERGLDALSAIGQNLAPFDAAVSARGSNLAVDAWAEAPDTATALHQVHTALAEAAAVCGLDTGDIVEQRVRPWADFVAEVDDSSLPALMSGAEAAELLGVSRQRVHQLATEHPAFPDPVYELGVGKLWLRETIETFARNWDRKPGRRKTAVEKPLRTGRPVKKAVPVKAPVKKGRPVKLKARQEQGAVAASVGKEQRREGGRQA
jgi:hypothetical protein